MAKEQRLIDLWGVNMEEVDTSDCTDVEDILSAVITYLSELPTVEAVEVVRCKDCKKISPSVTPIKDAVWCREFRAYMPCDGFCSYGERRKGE